MAADGRKAKGSPAGLTALEMRDRIAAGALGAQALTDACLERIAEAEPVVQAWAWLDGDHALREAAARDARRRTGRPTGPLHGLPVGVKDIIDTAGIPTANGTVIDAGRVPAADAFVVARLKAAGAVILGKTETAELAFLHPGRTHNPANPGHTPGGSSSGSAAAVAAGMVPLAVGTQTGGSVIRPAAYCGIVGFKPSFGAIPRTGILPQSPSLDTVGVFARTIEDAALLAEVLFGHDPADRASRPAPHPRLLDTALARPPVPPMFAFVRPPGWDGAAEETRLAMAELTATLGGQCFEAALPNAFDEAAAIRERINFAEMAKCYFAHERRGRAQMSGVLCDALDAGKAILARDYLAALDWPGVLNAGLAEIFARADAILTPATPSAAPEGLASTGSAIFNGLWTLCGLPAVTLPLLEAGNGLPMGVQLVGPAGEDARLLRTARWLMAHLAAEEPAAGATGGEA